MKWEMHGQLIFFSLLSQSVMSSCIGWLNIKIRYFPDTLIAFEHLLKDRWMGNLIFLDYFSTFFAGKLMGMKIHFLT